MILGWVIDGFDVCQGDNMLVIIICYDNRIKFFEEKIDQLKLRFIDKYFDVIEVKNLLVLFE